MKFNLKHIISTVFLLLFSASYNFLSAADVPPPAPPGGGGTTGPGAPSTPIDMYQVLLLTAAVFLIIYTVRKFKLSKV